MECTVTALIEELSQHPELPTNVLVTVFQK